MKLPAGDLQVRISRVICETYSKLTLKTPESHDLHQFDVFSVNFEHISHIFRVFPMFTLNG